MSASDSSRQAEHPERLLEHDGARAGEPTEMDYGSGGLPFYIGAIWITFLVSFTIYMMSYALPDLGAWFGP